MKIPFVMAGSIAAATISVAVLAQQPPPKDAAATAAPKCPATCVAPRSAVDTVARDTASGIGRVPDDAIVVSGPLTTDAEAPRGAALVARLARHVAGRLGPAVRSGKATKSLAEARADSKGAAGLIYLMPSIEAGRLRIVADAYSIPKNVWARARATQPGPIAHAQAQAPIDAEVRTFLKPLAFEQPVIAKYAGSDPDIVALACGDLDGDGGADLITMTRGRVLQVRLGEGKVTRLKEVRWNDLAHIAPVPLRQPIGFASIVEGPTAAQPRGYLDVSISDRAGSLRLDAALAVIRKMKGKAVPHGRTTACTWINDLLLGEKSLACSEREPTPALAELRHRADAIASTHLIGADGAGVTIVALRKDSTLVLRDASGDKIIGRVGAQLAIGDIDQDGALDVVTTIDTLAPRFDAVEVRTVHAKGTVERRFKVGVPSGVQAVAICPPDGPGRAPVVVATKEELWVLR